MGIFSFLFGSSNDSTENDEDRDDDDGLFSSMFGNPGDTTEDEDHSSGNYKEKDWYD
jgi:hypothetical protein